jgi:hypothetical protein
MYTIFSRRASPPSIHRRTVHYLFLGITYFLIDMIHYVETVDILVHHFISLWLCILSISHPVPHEVTHTIYNTEWSTLTLIGSHYMTGRPKRASQLLFVILFLKFRILGLFPLLYAGSITMVQRTPIIFLYGLNLVWLKRILVHLNK